MCRLQANFVFFFQGSAAEVEVITEEYAPPMYTKKEFTQLVADSTREKFSFLTINNKVSWDKRFRRNLDDFIILHRLTNCQTDKDETKQGHKRKRKEKQSKKLYDDKNKEANDSFQQSCEVATYATAEQNRSKRCQ